YEISKLESERLFLAAAKQNNFELVILRPTNVFGEFHPNNFLLNLMRHLKNHKPFLYSENAVVNYVYVKDVTNAIIYFIKNSVPERIYNIGKGMKLKGFVCFVYELLSLKPNTYKLPKIIIRFLELVNYFGISSFKNILRSISNVVKYDDDKIQNIVGYKYGIKEGLKRTFDYYKISGKL
ncbi:MAG: NAD(P)-dependent oxidoreductase, partial [Bacteroidales bacterium]